MALFSIMRRAPGHPEVYGAILAALEKRDLQPDFGDTSVSEGGPWAAAERQSTFRGGTADYEDDPVADSRLRLLSGSAAQRAGMQNLGNTCYANAAVQAVFTLTSFRRAIFAAAGAAAGGAHTRATRALFALLAGSRRRAIRPTSFMATCRPSWFPAGSQQDSAEFLVHWLDQLDREAEQVAEGKGENPVRQLTGTSIKKVTCRHCGHSGSREESFTVMPLPIIAEGV
jgi:ubiquitin C-terminal hydrolase